MHTRQSLALLKNGETKCIFLNSYRRFAPFEPPFSERTSRRLTIESAKNLLILEEGHEDYHADEIIAMITEFEKESETLKATAVYPNPINVHKQTSRLINPIFGFIRSWIAVDFILAQLDCLDFYENSGRPPDPSDLTLESNTLSVKIFIRAGAEKDMSTFNLYGRNRKSFFLEIDRSGAIGESWILSAPRMSQVVMALPE